MSTLLAVAPILAQLGDSSTQWNYVAAGSIFVIVGIALYIALVLRKGRQLARQLKPEDRRWMQ